MRMNKKIKTISLAICLVFLGVVLAGCAGQQAEEAKVEVPQEITIASNQEFTGIDPKSFFGEVNLLRLSMKD